MLLFSERITLVQKYENWLKNYPEIKDCSLSVISFLVSEKLIDEKKQNNFWRVKNGSCSVCR